MQNPPLVTVEGSHWFVEWVTAFLTRLADDPLLLLTTALIVATFFYAYTTWKTFGVMIKDLEHRIQPIIEMDATRELLKNGNVRVDLLVTNSNAPARILSAKGRYVYASSTIDAEGEQEIVSQPITFGHLRGSFGIRGHIIPKDGNRTFDSVLEPDAEGGYLTFELTYEDTVGLKRYEKTWDDVFGGRPQAVLERPTWWRRFIRIDPKRRRLRRAIKKAKRKIKQKRS